MGTKYNQLQSVVKYRVVPVTSIERATRDDMWQYWFDLKSKGLLKRRLVDTPNPTLNDVNEMFNNPSNMCFMLWDRENMRFCADTMLNNVQGLCAQVHFSIHPGYHGEEAIQIARQGAEQLFQLVSPVSKEPLRTLIGVTPVNNKLAVKFIEKIGFIFLDILENIFYNEESRSYTNGWLSKLHVEDLYNGR